MNVLCVMAHPDDEVLGAGGTLAKHAENGDKVLAFVLCDRDLEAELAAAGETLGITSVADVFADQMLDAGPFSEVVQVVERSKFDPDVIYTHHPGDLNLDHSLVARAVLSAFRAPDSQATILACEVLSSTEFGPTAFQPNHWEVLTAEQVDAKCKALDCYPTEVRDRPHPRNAEGIMVQARYRGQQVCQPYAEAFRVLRSIR